MRLASSTAMAGGESVDCGMRTSTLQKKKKKKKKIVSVPAAANSGAAAAARSGEGDADSSWTVLQRTSGRGGVNLNLGVQLALGGVVTAALVGAGAWLYLKKGDASRDGDKGRMKAK